jgi:membrane-bound ClpP family serine protease
MTPAVLTITLFAVGLVLLAAEVLLPTHGVLGVMAAGCIVWAIGLCYWIDPWLGVGAFLVTLALTPVGLWAAMKIWPKTPIGKRLFLQPDRTESPAMPPVSVGQAGVAVSALRPMGECDFGDLRLEVMSEHGMIAPGRKVRVVAISGGHAVVRPVTSDAEATAAAEVTSTTPNTYS